MAKDNSSVQNEWGSNLSFIFAMIGSAIGLGNIWRYPYLLYSDGGGAFYIPYLVAVFLLGIPFLILEYAVGYNFKSSFAKALTKIHVKLEFLGWVLPVSVYMLMIYYSTILGWDGIYVVLSFFKGWGSDPSTFFEVGILKSTESLSGLFTFIPVLAISMLVGWALVWFISHRDLEAGLGNVSKILVPLLFATMAIMVGYSVTLPGASIGLEVLFKPNWSLLLSFEIWKAAFGQIIFSLSLGMATAFTYASYSKKDADLISNTLSVAFANCFFENFAAIGVFSILGYMAKQSGKAIEEIVKQGTSLVFVAYPAVFNILGKVSYVLGPIFFITVYLAGITSMLSQIEPLSFCLQNKFGFSRKATVTTLCIIGSITSMMYATAYGSYLLGVVDTFVNEIAILISIVPECYAFAWIFDIKKLIPFLNEKSKFLKIGSWWLIINKYILPLFILVIWVGGIVDIIKDGNIIKLAITIICAIVLLGATTLFKLLPNKTEEWTKAEDRI